MKGAFPVLATLSLAALWTACAAIVGVSDVPTPLADAGPEVQAAPGPDGNSSPDSAAEDAASVSDGSSADVSVDVSATEAVDASDAQAATLDTGVPDVMEASADVQTVTGPCVDGLITKANGNMQCDDCGTTECCAELAVCQQPDDGGIDQNGYNKCEGLVYCIAGYENVNGATPELDCFHQDSTGTEQNNAEAVVMCLRMQCPTVCRNL